MTDPYEINRNIQSMQKAIYGSLGPVFVSGGDLVVRFSVDGYVPSEQRARMHTLNGRVYTSPRNRATRAAINAAALQASGGTILFRGPVLLAIIARFTPPKRWSREKKERALRGEIAPITKPDFDNIAKVVADSLTTTKTQIGLWHDDCQVAVHVFTKVYAQNEGVTVIVAPLQVTPSHEPREIE